MSRSHGTGQPQYFMCAKQRAGYHYDAHYCVRTGRSKPARPNAGVRVMDHQVEYRCICGHVGWSRHVEAGQLPMTDG